MKRVNECITIEGGDDDEGYGKALQQREAKKIKLKEIIESFAVTIETTDESEGDPETESIEVEEEVRKLSESQQRALDAVLAGNNVFVTGPAGTGKSFLIETIRMKLDELGKTHFTTATTGVAAHNIGGMTIHSYAGIQLGDQELSFHIKKLEERYKDKVARWKKTDVVIIDEASMLHPSFLSKLNQTAKIIRNKKHLPFGGIQVIFVGDLLQLPSIPPKADPTQTVLTKVDQYIFQCPTWKELKIVLNKLDVNFRQKDDEQFENLLNAVRVGQLGDVEKALLRTRDIAYNSNLIVPEGATKLFSYRNDVLRTNNESLARIKAETYFYEATIYQCPALQSAATNKTANSNGASYPVDAKIELKVGASVLLCVNLCVEMGLVNGSKGTIIRFIEESVLSEDGEKNGNDKDKKLSADKKVTLPVVRFKNGEQRIIRHHSWEEYDKNVLLSSFRQLPLMLSYAVTIHRAQGLTLDSALIDAKTFSVGQFYVAISRVRHLQDLFLINSDAKPKLADEAVLTFYRDNNLL